MLRLSKKADYALMAMKHLALRTDGRRIVQCPRDRGSLRDPARAAGEGAAATGARAVARRCRARAAAIAWAGRLTISVADVIQAVDGPVTVTACSPDDHRCEQYSKCSIRDPLWKIRRPHHGSAEYGDRSPIWPAEQEAPTSRTSTVSRMTFVPQFRRALRRADDLHGLSRDHAG